MEQASSAGAATAEMRFECVAIVGVGLIGGSLGMALRARGLAKTVVGVDRHEEALERAVGLGAIDNGIDLSAVGCADCVVFATPVGILPGLMEQSAQFIARDTVVTDVGSVKRRIVSVGERLFGARFVGGHPMAGSEASGVEAARPDLFEGSPWALITTRPEPLSHSDARSRIAGLVTGVGARTVYLAPSVHDHLVGLVSHLPHLLSFAFARAVASDPNGEQAIHLAGGSYRDLVRVSRSSPELWADIFLENRDILLPILSEFESSLHELRSSLETADRDALLRRIGPIQTDK